MTTTLYIKNMVCDRCIRVVREELTKLGLDVRSIRLGEVVAANGSKKLDREKVRRVLHENGFELLDDQRRKLIEKIKTLIINRVHYSYDDDNQRVNFSEYIAEESGHDYSYLSKLFSSIENATIEKFVILQKIERVKELLVYDELTLSEIAYRMRYSSVQHLSAQFKDVTGFTPTYFKALRSRGDVRRVKRVSLDKVITSKQHFSRHQKSVHHFH
ncbi:MAG: helix-turn-helix domain-containing protein [Bacteroidota bacterium]|nr:helix-turn-helix domain-containing protein [Bacteroidota bacterium]